MTLVESLHEKHKLFRAGIAAKAVPDNGIDLKRPPKVIPIAKIEDIQCDREQTARAIMSGLSPTEADEITVICKRIEALKVEMERLQERYGALGDKREDQMRPKIENIQKAVCKYYQITKTDLLSNRRTPVVVLPRQVGMWLCRKLTTRSFPEIGRRFGGRDHTTVLHAVRKIEGMYADPQFASEMDHLIGRFTVVSACSQLNEEPQCSSTAA